MHRIHVSAKWDFSTGPQYRYKSKPLHRPQVTTENETRPDRSQWRFLHDHQSSSSSCTHQTAQVPACPSRLHPAQQAFSSRWSVQTKTSGWTWKGSTYDLTDATLESCFRVGIWSIHFCNLDITITLWYWHRSYWRSRAKWRFTGKVAQRFLEKLFSFIAVNVLSQYLKMAM